MSLDALDYGLAAVAAVGAGVVNAVAGGGTLITFPTLVALGIPAVNSNITNTVALCPGYFGGTFAQRQDLEGQGHRLRVFSMLAVVGGLLGSVLLVVSSEELFRDLVPFLVLGACALLAFQSRIRMALPARSASSGDSGPGPGATAAMFVTCVYGGYFGAGMGIVTLATLSIAVPDTFPRTNALKQAVTLVTNVIAALFFAFSGEVRWGAALVMAPAALLGGNLGGRLARRVDARLMRVVVVMIGLVVAVQFWL
ncbi:MAG: TSUP family transporter [Acidimicrobiia bacterium]|nr:TSUP family transporter [Acidimicrobiia bacterium]